MATAAKVVASSPGPRPPYHALTMTAAKNSGKMLGSIADQSSNVSHKAVARAATATP